MAGTYQAKDGRVITDGYVFVDERMKDARLIVYPDGRIEIRDIYDRVVAPEVAQTFGVLQPVRLKPRPPSTARYSLTVEIERAPNNVAEDWAPTTFGVGAKLAEALVGKDLDLGWKVSAIIHGEEK